MAVSRHWVEDLFPPVYPLDPDSLSDGTEEARSVYELAARRISRYDPDTIRNVYERVWLLTAAQEQEAEERDRVQAAKEKREAELAERAKEQKTQKDQTSEDRIKVLLTGTIENGAEIIKEAERTRDGTPCLWTTDELAILRDVLTATRAENTRLRAELCEAEQRAADAEKRGRKAAVASRDTALAEAKKANTRLQVLIKHLKGEVERVEADNQELRDDLEDLKEQKAETEKDLQQQRQLCDAERIHRENLEIDLGDANQRAARALEHQEDRLAARHAYQVAALEKQLEELQVELAQEKKDHARTKNGLKHLQTHFSALPVHKPAPQSKVVREDQLTQWTY